MKVYLTRRYHFPASHRLHSDALSDAENRATYGKCNHPHGHGHNYKLSVTVGGPIDKRSGMVCDLVELDGFVQREVLERFDHQNLNTLPEFQEKVPTTELLCLEIESILRRGFQRAQVERIRLEETRKNSFESGRDMR